MFEEMVTLISNVGFPIATAAIMMWYIYDSNNKHIEQIEKLNECHKEEMKGIVSAVENNTRAIEILSEKLEGM